VGLLSFLHGQPSYFRYNDIWRGLVLRMQEQLLVFDPRQALRAATCGLGAAAVFALAGCGNNYRPVVNAINPVGPSSQPSVYAVALADPGNNQNGLVTVINVFGEEIVATAPVAPKPSYLNVDSSAQSYVLHSNSPLIDSFTGNDTLNPTSTNQVRQSSLDAGACGTGAVPNCPNQVTSNGASGPIFITEPALGNVAVMGAGTPPTIKQELPVPSNPVYTIANPTATRVYTLTQGSAPGTSTGIAYGIEAGAATANNAISATIPVGVNPIYGVMSADARRVFVMNKGDGTVSVIDTQQNALDSTTPSIAVGQSPLWADIAPNINELVVLNGGDGTGNGSLSIVNIALCSALALPGNTTCDPNHPTDAANFGKVLATVPVGAAPVQVAVLNDTNNPGKARAYIANAGDGTVSVIDLNTMTKIKDIQVGGKLNWIQAVPGAPTGKILVTASDSQLLTIINTDTDTLSTTVRLQGYGVAVRVAQ